MDPGTPRTGNVRVILHIEVGDVAFTLLHTAFVQVTSIQSGTEPTRLRTAVPHLVACKITLPMLQREGL